MWLVRSRTTSSNARRNQKKKKKEKKERTSTTVQPIQPTVEFIAGTAMIVTDPAITTLRNSF